MLDTIIQIILVILGRLIMLALLALLVYVLKVWVLPALLIWWHKLEINFNGLSYGSQNKNKSKDTELTAHRTDDRKEYSNHDKHGKTESAGHLTKVHTGIETDGTDREKRKRDRSPSPADFQTVPNNTRNQQKKFHKEESGEEIEKQKSLEKKKKDVFNPKSSKPHFLTYTNLSVVDGELVESTWGKASYYRCWSYENRFFFEFFCEESRLSKSINNHSVLIDPFCQKSGDSKPYNEAKSISTIEYGELDSNLNIVSKPLIKYS